MTKEEVQKVIEAVVSEAFEKSRDIDWSLDAGSNLREELIKSGCDTNTFMDAFMQVLFNVFDEHEINEKKCPYVRARAYIQKRSKKVTKH